MTHISHNLVTDKAGETDIPEKGKILQIVILKLMLHSY